MAAERLPGPDLAWIRRAEEALQAEGHRSTAPRAAIVAQIARQDCALTADQIAVALQEHGARVGIATVYRTLELLERLALLRRLDVGDGVARFEPSLPGGGHHHHHFVCTSCGRVVPFEDAELERAIAAIELRLPDPIREHEVILRADSCAACASPTPLSR